MVENSFFCIGRLVKDPEVRSSASGVAFANFAMALNRKGRDGKDETYYPEFVAFGKGAETIGKYVKKGSKLAVQATYSERMWEDKDGKKRKTVNFLVDSFHFCDSKNSSSDTASASTQQSQSNESLKSNTPDIMAEESEDDLPF